MEIKIFTFFISCNFIFSLINALVYVDIDIREKNKVAQNEKLKNLHGFSYVKSMANFEVFHWNILSSTNLQIARSAGNWYIVCQNMK